MNRVTSFRSRLLIAKAPRHHRRTSRRLSIERLEERQLLAFMPHLVKDINNTEAEAGSSFVSSQDTLPVVEGIVYFAAFTPTAGLELWRSDGTEAGTRRVKDIWNGSDGGIVAHCESTWGCFSSPIVDMNGTLYFTATDGTSGEELWKSDGTEAGTKRVKDIWPGSLGSRSNTYYYTHASVDETLYFSADDGTSGVELWKSDGTEGGTVRVKDIWPGADASRPRYLTNVGGTLYFIADDGKTGDELWKSDGTEAGTVRVMDIWPGAAGSNLYGLTNVNGTLYFAAQGAGWNRDLWKSDGTEAGTVRVKDILPDATYGFGPGQLTEINGTIFFTADDGVIGHELWKSDGTAAGTVPLKDIWPGKDPSHPQSLTNVNGTLYFKADDGTTGAELWKSDGTEAGTVRLKDIWPGETPSHPFDLTNVNGALYFSANDGTNGWELWMSDGTEIGTVAVDLVPGPGGSDPSDFTEVCGKLFFAATDSAHGRELWVADLNLLAGDVDDDGEVQFADFVILAKNFGRTDVVRADGDLNCDGSVDFADFLILSSNFGQSHRPTATSSLPPGLNSLTPAADEVFEALDDDNLMLVDLLQNAP